MTKTGILRKKMRDSFHNRKLQEAANLGSALVNPPSHGPGYANDLFNLALVYEELGRPDKAAALYMESARHLNINDDMALAMRTNNLAGVFARTGAYAPAYHFYKQTSHIYGRRLGTNHPAYADSLYNLANLAADTGRSEEALSLHKEALIIREKSGTTEDMMHSLHSIAIIYDDFMDHEKAASYAEAAFELATDADYARAGHYLADLYTLLDQYENVLAVYEKVLDKLAQLGDKGSNYVTTLSRKAKITKRTGRKEEALSIYSEVLDAYQLLESIDLVVTDPLFYANCMKDMAVICKELGHATRAEYHMMMSLKSRRANKGELTEDICFLLELHLQTEDTYHKAMDMLVYALIYAEDPTGPGTDKVIDALMDVLARAEDTGRLLSVIKDVNDAGTIKNILDMWQNRNGYF